MAGRTPPWFVLSAVLHVTVIGALATVTVAKRAEEAKLVRVAILSGTENDAKPGGGSPAGPPPAPVAPAPPKAAAPPKVAAPKKLAPKPAPPRRQAKSQVSVPPLLRETAPVETSAPAASGSGVAAVGGQGGGGDGGGQGAGSGQGRGSGKGGSPLGRYLARVRRQIEEAKRYPAVARRNRLEGRVAVSFELSRSGEALHLELRHADHPVLAEAALLAVRSASPFGELPDGEEQVRVEVPLKFSLHEGGVKP
jgi:protein TonB